MTNLVEKTLLLGFGLFTLTIFTSIIVPFMGEIANFNQNDRNDLELCFLLIDEIDRGIHYLELNPEVIYLKVIEYPPRLNVSFYENVIKYEFKIDNHLFIRINEYNQNFVEKYFYNIIPQKYILNISTFMALIQIIII